MSHRYGSLIVVLGATWGASYLFIKVGVEGGLSPSFLMAARSLIAAALLFAYLAVTMSASGAVTQLRGAWRSLLVLGALNAAVPFWLVAWGEEHIDSGIAAIAQATVPIFTLLIGLPFLPHERVGGWRVAGVIVGLVGVVLVAGIAPQGDMRAVAGTLAVVLASVSYASAAIYGQLQVYATPGPVLATGSMLAGGLVLLPFALADAPTETPTRGAVASLLALTVLGTTLAQLIAFRILLLYGARRLSLVTYLMPGFALVYGTLVLGESFRVAALAGLVLILLGVALGSGALRPGRRPRPQEAPAR